VLYNRNEDEGGAKITPDLAKSETMLWAFHNRAADARRIDEILVDPDSARIRNSWGNAAPAVTSADVKDMRQKLPAHGG
jgi:hypothetical protein